MVVWCLILFALGVGALLDSVFNYGNIYRQVNSVLFMLVALGLIVRCSLLSRMKLRETMTSRVREMERELRLLETRHRHSPNAVSGGVGTINK